jgi:hypothetical protein
MGMRLSESDRAHFVHRLAQHVHDAAQGGLAHRHRDGGAGVLHHGAALQAVGGTHGDGADHAVTQLLLDLEGERGASILMAS